MAEEPGCTGYGDVGGETGLELNCEEDVDNFQQDEKQCQELDAESVLHAAAAPIDVAAGHPATAGPSAAVKGHRFSSSQKKYSMKPPPPTDYLLVNSPPPCVTTSCLSCCCCSSTGARHVQCSTHYSAVLWDHTQLISFAMQNRYRYNQGGRKVL